jgi:hypothetical protein
VLHRASGSLDERRGRTPPGAADAIDDYLAQQTPRLARTHGTGSWPEVGQRDLRVAIVAAGAIQIRDDRGPQSVG